MKTTYILKSGVQITFDDVAKTYTLISGATLLSVKETLTPILVDLRKANATEKTDGTATTNVDLTFKSISALASLVQGASTNGKTWLDRNCKSKTGLTDDKATETTSTNVETKSTNPNKDAGTIYKMLDTFCKDFKFRVSARLFNTIVRTKDAKNLILNSLDLYGVDNFVLEDAEKKLNSIEFKEIEKKLYTLKTSKKINQRLEIYYGFQGTGKTTLATTMYPSAAIVSGNEAADPDELFVRFDPTTKTYVLTEIGNAMNKGEVVIVDEGNLYTKPVWTRLQAVLDKKCKISDHGVEIIIKDGFKIITTMNLEDVVTGNKKPLPTPIVDRAEVIKKFDNIDYDLLASYAL